MSSRPIYVEIDIRADLDTVWRLTQDTDLHPKWDARFSRITPQGALDGGGYRFLYETRLPLHTIRGMGTSIGEVEGARGTRTSALRFTTRDRLSPLGDGRGYWRYIPTASGVTFITGYDYVPGWGRMLDSAIVRPLVGWLTAWSFDRLRIWAETGVEPGRWWVPSSVRPRASNCRRSPRRGRAMDDAPDTLDRLEKP